MVYKYYHGVIRERFGKFTLLTIALLFAFTGATAILSSARATSLDPFPSTNENNTNRTVPGRMDQSAPYVSLVSSTADTVTVKFVNHTNSQAFFEVRKDGVEAGSDRPLHYNPCKPSTNPLPKACLGLKYLSDNERYYAGGISVDNRLSQVVRTSERTETFSINSSLEVRLALGGERDWDFDWTPFYVLQAPDAPTNLQVKDSANKLISNGGFTNSYSVAASWGAVEEAASYEYSYWNNIPGNRYKEGTRYIINNGNRTTRSGSYNQGEGTHYIAVRTIDEDGIKSEWSETYAVTYDNTAPIAEIVKPNDNEYLRGSVKLVGTVTDANPMNSHFDIRDSSNKRVASETKKDSRETHEFNWDTTKTPDGKYTIYFEARDKAQNKDGSVQYPGASVDRIDVNVKNHPPTVPEAVLTADNNGDEVLPNGHTDSKHFAFNLSASGQPTRYQLKYWNDIVNSTFKENKPWNPKNLSSAYKDNFTQGEGVHYFSFSACDILNNCSVYSEPFVVTYDNTPPEILFSEELDSSTQKIIHPGTTLNLNATVTDNFTEFEDLKFLWSYEIKPDGATEPNFEQNDSLPTTVIVDEFGDYVFRLTAEDKAGNKGSRTIEVELQDPDRDGNTDGGQGTPTLRLPQVETQLPPQSQALNNASDRAALAGAPPFQVQGSANSDENDNAVLALDTGDNRGVSSSLRTGDGNRVAGLTTNSIDISPFGISWSTVWWVISLTSIFGMLTLLLARQKVEQED
jgi:hypothetical protein